MKHNDLTDEMDQNGPDIDALLRDLGAPDTEDAVLDDILREYGSKKPEAPRASDDSPAAEAADQAELEDILSDKANLETFRDSGTYRSFDGNREYRSFDETLPDASPEEWYRSEDEDAVEYYDEDEEDDEPRRRHPVLSAIGHGLLVIATALSILYLLVIYSNIPMLNDLRTMYIQTAMSTYSHKWMATAIVPREMILEVMRDQYETDDAMQGINSSADRDVSNWRLCCVRRCISAWSNQ